MIQPQKKHVGKSLIGACIWAAMFSILFSASVVHAEAASAWGVTKVSVTNFGNHYPRGYQLYTKGTESKGLAFRCDKGELFAFVAVKPVDFRKKLQEKTRRPRDREVSFRINDGKDVSEEWVQMFSGKIYMVRKMVTTRDLFKAATRGATISFTRKYGKEVILTIPKLESRIVKPFLEVCNLKKELLASSD